MIIIVFFRNPVAANFNDNGLSFYSLSLNMKLNIPKYQRSFTVQAAMCIVGGLTSRSLSQVFLNV